MSIRQSLTWMALAQLLAFALQFATTILLARYLSLHDAGIYAAAQAVVGVLSLVQALGLQALIVREETLTPEVSATAFTLNAAISVLLSAAIAGGGAWGGEALGDAGVRHALLALSVTPLFAIPTFLPAAMLERHGRFREIALIGVAGIGAGTLATAALLVAGYGYMSAAYAQWANGATVAVLFNVVGRRHASLRIGVAGWRRVADFGFQMLAVTGINQLSIRLSDLLLARILGLSALGIYSRASGLNTLLWVNIHLLVGRVMLVDFAEIHRAGQPLRDRYIRTVAIVTALLWPVFTGLAVLAGPFILVAFGRQWLPAAVPLALIAVSSAVQVAITMTWEVFAATGELRTQTRIEFVRSLVAVGAFAAGALVSLELAAAARVADALFALVLYRPHLNRMTGTSGRDFVGVYLASGALTLAACGPAAVLMAARGWRADVPMMQLAAAVGTGALLWVAALAASGHPLLVELRRRPIRAS